MELRDSYKSVAMAVAAATAAADRSLPDEHPPPPGVAN